MAGPRRIAITGAGGFVGGWLMAALAAKAFPGEVATGSPVKNALEKSREAVELTPLTAHGGPEGEKEGRAPGTRIDVAARDEVFAMVEALRPDAIVHLAAIAAPADAKADPDHAWRVNVDGTLNLARAILKHAPRCRLVFAGSSEAYGESFNDHGGVVGETAALRPATAYGASKAAADIALGQMAHDGLDVVRLRPFNHTGPGQSPAFVVPAFAAQVAAIIRNEREPVVEVGNLDAVRDFLDVRDVVAAYVLACDLEAPLSGGPAINLASGEGRSIRSILDALIERSGRVVEIRADPARMRPSQAPKAVGDPALAAELLGWKPQIPFDRTIGDVLGHFLQDGKR